MIGSVVVREGNAGGTPPADSGARRGELTALQTTDLQGRVLAICRASQDGVIGSVKNHLNGRLTLATSTAAYWTSHVQDRASYLNEDKETADAAPQWLFRATPESDMPLLPNGLGRRFENLAHAAGHPDATLHRLRHTVGTVRTTNRLWSSGTSAHCPSATVDQPRDCLRWRGDPHDCAVMFRR